jgi:uncharacterized protein (DUF362 family)
MMHSSKVLVIQQNRAEYPQRPPFHPAIIYPEAPIKAIGHEANQAYDGVRELFRRSGYDAAAFGTPEWNPLSGMVKPGDTVFLKPNMISHKHAHCDDWDYVITHGSIIRAAVDYTYLALRGMGRVIIGDAPQCDSKFNRIVEHMGLSALQELYWKEKNFEIEILDLRDEYWIERDGIYVDTVRLPGDPRGSIAVDLAADSMFSELDGQGKVYYGAFYNIEETNFHHQDGKHEYAISRSPVSSDVFINLPKLKTHKKCGITVNLKSLVGINANKNWLPHYALGSPECGGDQFRSKSVRAQMENSIVLRAKQRLLNDSPRFKQFARNVKHIGYRIFGDNEHVIRSGNWHGNDTVWRMCLDLNRILMYGNPDGTMGEKPKRFFSIVDGIHAMEGNGPVAGTMKPAGLVIGGGNPAAVDAVCAALMGYDLHKLPLLERAFGNHRYPIAAFGYDDIDVCSNVEEWSGPLSEWASTSSLAFRPHFGWIERVELRP